MGRFMVLCFIRLQHGKLVKQNTKNHHCYQNSLLGKIIKIAEDVGKIIKIVYLVKLITFLFCVALATFNSLTLK